ncbi:S41 family peptidase [Thermocrinis jamiesonii]|uniref:S41 family peptidase n=1 Tax=Thermocrinis jamiesonii TaxID=1302351 RepID=UPI000495E1E7|nr:S41 family peptidase [Thermocrinis jamiesonii]
MSLPLLLLILLVFSSYAQEYCPKEETLAKLKDYIARYYLWKHKIGELPEWKDESEAIAFLRSKGDRWTTITKLEDDRNWYSEAKMFGIGIRWDEDGTIVKVFENSPAQRIGLKPGDIIYSINGETDKSKWSIIIRNTPADIPIRLVIIKNGMFVEVEIFKDYFTVNPIEERRIIMLGNKKLGYVHLVNFTNPAVKGFADALWYFQEEGIDALIINLSNNSGGLISVAKAIADMLISGEGVMFYLEGSGNGISVYEFKKEKMLDKPIFVIVNKNTASAAELLASLLKRYAGAIVAGEPTVGKYVGSNMYFLNNCGLVLRLITFAMKLPDGSFVVGEKGLEPDCRAEKGNLEKALDCFKSVIAPESLSASP